MSRNRFLIPTLVIVAAFALGACGSTTHATTGSNSNGDTGGVTVTTQAAKTGTPISVEDGENPDGSYFMKLSTDTVPAGPVTFTMKNTGTKQHEMVVLKTDTPADQLKVNADHRVSEADSVGEVSETDAGKSGSVTIDLKPGKYVLVCNIANHYEKGMYAALTVTSNDTSATTAGTAAGTAQPVTVDVTADDYTFQSSLTTFKVGVPYHFVVHNVGKIKHEFMIVKPIAAGTMDMEAMDKMAVGDIEDDDLQPGATASVDVTFDKAYPAGTLEFACHVGQHYEKGMRLPIVVES